MSNTCPTCGAKGMHGCLGQPNEPDKPTTTSVEELVQKLGYTGYTKLKVGKYNVFLKYVESDWDGDSTRTETIPLKLLNALTALIEAEKQKAYAAGYTKGWEDNGKQQWQLT